MAKYLNKPTLVDGHKFDSKKEAARSLDLKLQFRAGLISDLYLQPKFRFEINGKPLRENIGENYHRSTSEIFIAQISQYDAK